MTDCTDATAFADAVSQLTTAFGDATRRSIYLRCREAGDVGVTTAEVARQFDLHSNVARHHLDKLVEGGYLEAEFAGGVRAAGRPSKHYRASAKDVILSYPTRRDDLLVTLLASALETLDPEQATALAEKVGYDYGQALASEIRPGDEPATLRQAMGVVADALNSHGFAATVETEGKWHATITSSQCPFGAAAHAHPHLICALDRGMVKGMLATLYGDTCPETTASRPSGDPFCITRV